MIIRPENPKDVAHIRHLTNQAFANMTYSSGTEANIIDALREHGQLTLSLVAEQDGTVIGQITISPVTIDGEHDGWFGLGPVAVLPDKQGRGVGSDLINHALDRLKAQGAKGCVLVGNPNYYSRFGFVNKTGLFYGDLDRKFIQKLMFVPPTRNGQLVYCDAFEKATSRQDQV